MLVHIYVVILSLNLQYISNVISYKYIFPTVLRMYVLKKY